VNMQIQDEEGMFQEPFAGDTGFDKSKSLIFWLGGILRLFSVAYTIRRLPVLPSKSGAEESRSTEMDISLGLVNDLVDDIIGEDEEDTPRQAAGDELVSSNTKWHKHTVKVFTLLKRSMTDAEDSDRPHQLSFDNLSKGSSRRTAAGVFFELLQLKTWDYIEIDQGESYGDIMVSILNQLRIFGNTETHTSYIFLGFTRGQICRRYPFVK